MNQPYTRTPNWFFDVLPTLKGAETKLLLALIRLTFGWHRDEVPATPQELRRLSGIESRTTLNATIRSLVSKGLLVVREGQSENDRIFRVPETVSTVQKMDMPPLRNVQKLDSQAEESVQKLDSQVEGGVQKLDASCPKIEHPPVQKLDTSPPSSVQKLDTFDPVLKKKDVKKAGKKEEEESATPAPVHPAIKIYQEILRRTPDAAECAYLERALPELDTQRWQDVCRLWRDRGWQSHMLSGLVDRYRRNAPARASPTLPPVAPAPPPETGTITLEAIDF